MAESNGDRVNATINERIKVFIRQRPDVSPTVSAPEDPTAAVGNKENVTSGVKSYTAGGECSYYSSTSKKYTHFKFEGFLPPTVAQSDVYDVVAKPIVASSLQGYPGTIFAYGPTNSGKTHTIRGGSHAALGIMPRCIEDLLFATSGGRGQVWVSYLQIYCEVISDLLVVPAVDCSAPAAAAVGTSEGFGTLGIHPGNSSSSSSSGAPAHVNPLTIRERAGSVFVEGLSRTRVTSLGDLDEILRRGDMNRSTASTNMNETSSRSHAALMVTVVMRDDDNGDVTAASSSSSSNNGGGDAAAPAHYRECSLVIVDLAGSERASASEGRSCTRLEEAKAINLSLSALGNCMNALAEGRAHVPYRDSKLTRLLQGCLGGGARTSIVVTLPPGSDDNGEALNALRFASRASAVKVAAKIMRFTDFEGMYNEAQRALDSVEQREREKALQLARASERMVEQEGELERLRDEVRTLKAQAALGPAPDGGPGLRSSCPHCGHGRVGGGGGSDRTRNPEAQRGGTSALDTAAAFLAKHEEVTASAQQQSLLQALSEQHLQDLAAVRRELEAKVSSQKKQAEEAQQEVAALQYELQSERTRHLESLADVRRYHQRAAEVESAAGVRVQELLAELAEKNTLIDELRADAGTRHGSGAAPAPVTLGHAAAAEVHLGPNGEELVSRAQLLEMESLFLDTVNKLSSRVIELEKAQRLQLQIAQQQLAQQRTRGASPSSSSSAGVAVSVAGDERLPPIPRGHFGSFTAPAAAAAAAAPSDSSVKGKHGGPYGGAAAAAAAAAAAQLGLGSRTNAAAAVLSGAAAGPGGRNPVPPSVARRW